MNKIEEIIGKSGYLNPLKIQRGLLQWYVKGMSHKDGIEYEASGDTLESAFQAWAEKSGVTHPKAEEAPLDLLKTYSINEIHRLFKTKAGHLLKIDENINGDEWILDGLVWENDHSTKMLWNAFGTAFCDNRDYDLILDPIGHIEPLDQAFVLEFNPWFRFCVDTDTNWYEYGKAFGVNKNGVNLFDWQGYSKFYPFKVMREKEWAYSLDGGKQWLPCRKNEPEN